MWRGAKQAPAVESAPEIEKLPEPLPLPEWHDAWKALAAEYPVRRSFAFLGRSMVVAQAQQYFPGLDVFPFGFIDACYPSISTHYVDERGVIQTFTFEFQKLDLLKPNWRGAGS